MATKICTIGKIKNEVIEWGDCGNLMLNSFVVFSAELTVAVCCINLIEEVGFLSSINIGHDKTIPSWLWLGFLIEWTVYCIHFSDVSTVPLDLLRKILSCPMGLLL